MKGITTFVFRRLALTIPTIFIIMTVIFMVLNVLPGDAATAWVGLEKITPEGMAQIRERMGLNYPVPIRYLRWIWGVLHGRLGVSLISGIPVEVILTQRVPYTLAITAMTLLLSTCIAIPVGILAALKRNTIIDFLASAGVLVGVSIPTFWYGILLILLFSVSLGWFPSAGLSPDLWTSNPLRAMTYLILPSMTLGAWTTAYLARIVRSSMLEVMMQDYIVAARSKGLAERVVIFRHGLRNSMIPVVTVLGLEFAALVGGAVVTESIFGIAGLGTMILDSVLKRDFVVLQGILLFTSTLMLILNLIVDVTYAAMDPRVRLK